MKDLDLSTRQERLQAFLIEARALKPGEYMTYHCATERMQKAEYILAYHRLRAAGINKNYTFLYRQDEVEYLFILKRK